MSEYWKSTPKYWCKHCKTFIRDTKPEKANHEATPKHQGNLKRFLKELHRGHEKDEKDKERAKSEVARLNGLVSGEGASSSYGAGFGRGPTPSIPKPQATAAQRKQQLAQLAEMGVSIPDEFRPDMAMAGEWQVTSERIIEGNEERKPEALALGVRKRVHEEGDEEYVEAKKKRWGSKYLSHPTEDEDSDLDALLNHTIGKGKELDMKTEAKADVKVEDADSRAFNREAGISQTYHTKEGLALDGIKEEPLDTTSTIATDIPPSEPVAKIKGEVPGVIFKKRKAKNIRQK